MASSYVGSQEALSEYVLFDMGYSHVEDPMPSLNSAGVRLRGMAKPFTTLSVNAEWSMQVQMSAND